MKLFMKLIKMSALVLIFVVSGTNIKAETLEQFGSPAVLINAGDSGGIYTTTAICNRAGIQFDVGIDVKPEDIEKGSGRIGENREKYGPTVEYIYSNFPLGTQYETVIVTIGTPNRGIGIRFIEYILKDVKANLDWAKENKIPVIGVYVDGKDARGDTVSDTETLIDFVAPYCDILMTTVSGNDDGRFTKLGEELGIPVIEGKNLTALVGVFQELFGIEPVE